MAIPSTAARWRRVAALTAAGLYYLPALTLRLADALAVLWLLRHPVDTLDAMPRPLLWGMVSGWALQALLLPPLHLGRLAMEQALTTGGTFPSLACMGQGFRRFFSAIAWRAHLWGRRWLTLWVTTLPTTVLWGFGSHLTAHGDNSAAPLLWLGLGGLLLPLELLAAWLWLSRYALAPFLLLEGCPAGAAMQFSARAMAGHRRAYINFWGSQAGRLAACLAILPIPFVLPAIRLAHTRWLTHLRQKTTIFTPASAGRGCILPSGPI